MDNIEILKRVQEVPNKVDRSEFDETVTEISNDITEISNDITEIDNKTGILSNLTTTDKGSVVGAINELGASLESKANGKTIVGNNTTLYQSDFENIEQITLIGSFVINSTINLQNIKIKGNGNIKQSATIYINEFVTIENITFDLDNSYNESIFIKGSNVNIVKCSFLNGYSTTFARFIYISNTSENTNITNCKFDNIYAFENGVNGDSVGSVRCIQSQNVKRLVIKENSFSNIKGTEDSDYIAILSPSTKTINDKVYFEHGDILIENNTFIDVQKSAVKIQCSGVKILNNFIKSNGVVFTRILFRVYQAIDVIVNGNYTDTNCLIECALQIDNNLNCIYKNNTFTINKQSEYTGSVFSVMDTSSINIDISNNKINSDKTTTLLIKFTSSQYVTCSNNLFENSLVEFVGVKDVKINNNSFTGTTFSTFEIGSGTVSQNLYLENNTITETQRLINIRSEGNTNINLINNTIINQPLGFVALSFFIATQGKDQFYIVDKNTKNLSFGASLDRPIIKKYIGYPYFDTTINKQIHWNGSVWKDATGTTV